MQWTGAVGSLHNQPWVAVIGPRQASPALQRMAFRLAARLAAKGKVVVSGLAAGIDAAAHRGALSVPEGRTAAIVSTAPDEPVYPADHADLARRIVAAGGALGHPFAQSATSWAQRRWRLVERDLVVAETVTGIYVVTDDDPIDGGSRWAVARAYELGRPVVRVDSQGRLWDHPAIVPTVWTGVREAEPVG
ncbi:MAG: DNA-processing protein DprA [Sulfobacillus sp.]|nr:DNA-processing protein DprA [Sulfobacillus sp.]